MVRANSKSPSFIAPERVYALSYAKTVSGLSETRRREAKQRGIVLSTIDVGRRKFVRGSALIEYIEQLAALESGAAK